MLNDWPWNWMGIPRVSLHRSKTVSLRAAARFLSLSQAPNIKVLFFRGIIFLLVNITQVNSTLAQRRLAKYYSPPSSRRKTKWTFVGILSQMKFLFGLLVIHLSVGESGGYLPPLR